MPSSAARFASAVALLYLLAFVLVVTRDALLPTLAAPEPLPDLPPAVQELEAEASSGRAPAHDDTLTFTSWLGPAQTTVKSGERNAWKDHNQLALRKLHECLSTRTCGKHQTKVLVLQDPNFRKAYYEHLGGEKIWSRSILRALDQLGVTYFMAAEYQLVGQYYSMLPDLVRATFMQCEALEECWANKDGDCLKTRENPHGIPIEHLFCSEFFGHGMGSPLGAQWSLAPEPFKHQPIEYQGYSIEDECTQNAVVPFEKRLRRVWVLAKHYRYFTSKDFPYSRDIFVRASAELGVEFVGAYNFDDVPLPHADFPGVTNLGVDGQVLDKEAFEHEVRQSLAIVGVWDPIISPTPYYGLCWALPFVNPGDYGYDDEGALAKVVASQHQFAALEGEPHVYNVQQHDDEAFIAAVRKAISKPHASYIPDRMRMSALRDRLVSFLDTDFNPRLRELVADEAQEKLKIALHERQVIY